MKTSSDRTADNPRSRLAEHLLSICEAIGAAMPLPPVDHIYLPPAVQATDKSRKFGLVVLEDHSTGFFFTLLEDAARDPHAPIGTPSDALELAHWLTSPDIARRAIGLGAISAITQSLFRATGFRPPDAINPIADLKPDAEDHIGMVGYFPALVDRLRERGIPLTVLELDESWVQQGHRFEVTLDPARLASCNKILCTASTLINDTVDDILHHAGHADYVAIIGPSAGCPPEPLFARGVDLVGGSAVMNFGALEACCDSGEDWGASVRKYCLSRENYPGTLELVGTIGYGRG